MTSVVFKVRQKADVRWVRDSDEHPDDGHFERFCPSCHKKGKGESFHELCLEFWNPHNLNVCRTCLAERRAREQRQRRQRDREFRQRQVEQSYAIRYPESVRARELVRLREVQES